MEIVKENNCCYWIFNMYGIRSQVSEWEKIKCELCSKHLSDKTESTKGNEWICLEQGKCPLVKKDVKDFFLCRGCKQLHVEYFLTNDQPKNLLLLKEAIISHPKYMALGKNTKKSLDAAYTLGRKKDKKWMSDLWNHLYKGSTLPCFY